MKPKKTKPCSKGSSGQHHHDNAKPKPKKVANRSHSGQHHHDD